MEVATIQKRSNGQEPDSLQWQYKENIMLRAKNNKLLIEQAPKNQRKNIKEFFKYFKSENYSPCEIDWSKPVGDEIW